MKVQTQSSVSFRLSTGSVQEREPIELHLKVHLKGEFVVIYRVPCCLHILCFVQLLQHFFGE